jgi:hypothetical protein
MESGKQNGTSRIIVWAIGGIAVLIVLLLVFRVGMVVGYRQAQYSFIWQTEQNGTMPMMRGPGFFADFGDNNRFMNAHGTFGTVVSLNTLGTNGISSLVVHDTHDMADKTVEVSSTTAITGPNGPLPFSAITAGQRVAVVGAPDAGGDIDASIIRIIAVQATSSPAGLPPPSKI